MRNKPDVDDVSSLGMNLPGILLWNVTCFFLGMKFK